MRQPVRFFSFALLLCLPAVAWAGGTAVVAPLVAAGVDGKVTNNLTSLLGSELDFSGVYDTVTEIPAPASLNNSCLTSTSCLGAIAKANEADVVITGSIAPGGAGLKVNLVLYDAKKNAIVRKKSYDLTTEVSSMTVAAPRMVKEITGRGAAAVEEEESVKADVFEDEEEEFDMESGDLKGKTRFTPDTKKKGKIEDAEDDEDAEERASALAKAKAAVEAKAKREADAKAKADAEAKAKAKADAEEAARVAAEAKAKAKAEAEARARREAEERAEEDEAKAKAVAAAKKKKPSKSEDEELEEELANFSFGGGGKVSDEGSAQGKAKPKVAEVEEEESAEDEAPKDTRSFSERYASSKPQPTKSPAKTTTSRARVDEEDEAEEPEEEDEDETADEPEEEEEKVQPRKAAKPAPREEEEEEPRASARKVAPEDEEETPRFSARTKAEEEEEEEEAPRFSARKEAEEEEDEEPPPKKRASSSDDDEPRRPQIDEDARSKFGILLRGGWARYGTLDFVTYGVELEIPVSSRLVVLAGVEGASTNRNYTDEERAAIAAASGQTAEQIQDWNLILPLDLGLVYKVPISAVQPYVGADFLAVVYTANGDFAFGGRVRGGCDFMVSDNFGFNVDGAIGVLAGDKFDLIQAGLADVGLYPEVSLGTILTF